MSAKNYSYQTQNKVTKEPSGRCTKIRGLSHSDKAQASMDTERMLSFVEKIQQDEKVQELVPQIRQRFLILLGYLAHPVFQKFSCWI